LGERTPLPDHRTRATLGYHRRSIADATRTASRYRLLHGPYTEPTLRRGDRAVCLFRDGDVLITVWSTGRIPWPRCRLPGTRGGGSGLPVAEEHSLL
jgi:hypothetical protein